MLIWHIWTLVVDGSSKRQGCWKKYSWCQQVFQFPSFYFCLRYPIYFLKYLDAQEFLIIHFGLMKFYHNLWPCKHGCSGSRCYDSITLFYLKHNEEVENITCYSKSCYLSICLLSFLFSLQFGHWWTWAAVGSSQKSMSWGLQTEPHLIVFLLLLPTIYPCKFICCQIVLAL